MDSSYASATAAEEPESPSPPESVDEENAGQDTAIVSNKILSPDGEALNEGDEIVVRIVKNYGDESEIEYAPKEGSDESETTEEPMSTAAKELTALSDEGQ